MAAPSKRQVVVVVGCAGFVGSKLSANLLELGYHVLGIDNFLTGTAQNIAHLKKDPHFSFLEIDLNKDFPTLNYPGSILAVLHVASIEIYSAPADSRLNEFLVNSFGVKILLDFCLKKKARFVFSSTVDVYEGLASRISLSHYYGEREEASRLSFLEAKRFSESLCQEYFQSYGLDIRIARFAQVYGPGMNLFSSSTLARLLRLAKDKKDLIVDEEGSQEHQLLYVDDAVFGLAQLAILEKEELRGGIFYFASPERVSTLSLVYTLKELLGKETKVDFLPNPQKTVASNLFPVPRPDLGRTQKALRWEAKVNITNGLRETLESFLPMSQEKKVVPPTKVLSPPSLLPKTSPLLKGVEERRSGFSLKLKSLLFIFLAFYFLVSLTTTLSLLALSKEVDQAQKDWQRGDVKGLKTSLQGMQKSAGLARLGLFFFRPLALFGLNDSFEFADKSLIAGQKLSSLAYLVSDELVAVKDLFSQVASHSPALGGKVWDTPPNLSKEFFDNWLKIRSISSKVQEVSLGLLDLNPTKLPPLLSLPQKGAKVLTGLALFSDLLSQSSTLQKEDWAFLLGEKETRRYLFLFQNSNELRPTGGFIGSFGVLTVDKDALTSLEINDIYNLDGLLKTKIAAPPFFKEYLRVNELGVRDANYSPDFARTAERVIFLYQSATNQIIDGVMAFNLQALENILQLTGPLVDPETKREINSENFAEKAQIEAEVGFEPGSTNKKDFLTKISSLLIEKLKTDPRLNKFPVATSFFLDLRRKNILLYLSNAGLEKILSQYGWSGQTIKTSGDYLWLVDTNVSANKVNYWVKRQSEYSLSVDREGKLQANLTVRWSNEAPSASWPAGEYLNYFRVFVPQESKLIKGLGFSSDISSSLEEGHAVFGGLVKVKVGETKEISLVYDLPSELSLVKKGNYSLLVQKQPGIEGESFSWNLSLPLFLKTAQETRKKAVLDQDWSYSLTISR